MCQIRPSRYGGQTLLHVEYRAEGVGHGLDSDSVFALFRDTDIPEYAFFLLDLDFAGSGSCKDCLLTVRQFHIAVFVYAMGAFGLPYILTVQLEQFIFCK